MTPEIVIQNLRSIGYFIRVDGEDILLTSDHDPQDPELAMNLLTELKLCKTEAVNILKTSNTITHTEKTQPGANVKAIWSPEVQSLIEWFIELKPSTEPFYLEPHRKVIDPEKFFVSLQNEIAIGTSCPRNRTGALLCDLKILKKILH